MRIYVVTDLEGAAMVFRFDQCGETGDPRKAAAMRILTGEANACVDGILDAEPSAEVVVWDGHGTGGIVPELFTDRAALVAGRVEGTNGFDGSFDALFFVGQHAMAGTEGGVLAHSYSAAEIEHYKVNGRPVGEFGLRALRAGTVHGVPAAFLSGDDKAVAEAVALVPNLVGVEVKWGLALEAARSLGAGEARRRIREGAAEAIRRVAAGRVPPARIEPPYEIEVRARPGREAFLDELLRLGAERLDPRTVVARSEDPRAALRARPSRSIGR